MTRFHRLTCLAAVLVCGTLAAQESVGTVTGIVRDDKGAPVAGALVTLTSPVVLGQRTMTTNAKGEYRVPLLLPGDYVLAFSKSGTMGQKATFRIGAGQTIRQDATLKVVTTETTTVEVVAVAAAVDKTETKTSTNVTLETLQALPLGLNSYAAVALSPGVVAGNGSTAYPTVRGSIIGQTRFTVNGINVNDNAVRQGRQFEVAIDDLTADVSVIQSPLNAKYGNVSGGIVNLVTKTGTNTFEGSLRAKLSKGSWAASAPAVPARYRANGAAISTLPPLNALNASTIASDDLARTYEATILGPIIKDHLTFAFATRQAPTTSAVASLTNIVSLGLNYVPLNGVAVPSWTYGANPTTGADGIVGGSTVDSTNQAKLFWLVNPDHQVEFFYTWEKFGPAFDTQSGNLDTFATFRQSSDRKFYGVNYRGIFGSSVLDVKYGNKQSSIHFSSGPYDPITMRFYTPSATTIFNTATTGGTALTNGDTASPLAEERKVESLSANYNMILGSHSLDLGFDGIKETFFGPDQSGPNRRLFFSPGRVANGDYVVYNYIGSTAQTSTNSTFRQPGSAYVASMRLFEDAFPGKDTHNYDTSSAFYVNDLWTLSSNWSIMGGLRFDHWKVEDMEGVRVSTSAVSPRFEVKWDPLGNNQHVFNFSYGQFRGTIGQGNMGGLFPRRPGGRTSNFYWNQGSSNPYLVNQAAVLDPNNYGYVASFADTTTLFQINPDLKPEVAHEYTVGYRRAFRDGGFLRATFVYREYKDMWYRRGVNSVVTIPDWHPGSTLPPSTGFLSILDTDPYQKRKYSGLEFEWQQALVRNKAYTLDMTGNWTIARTRSNETWREGNVGSSNARFEPEFRAAGLNPDYYNPYGELPASFHNSIKNWLTLGIGQRKGARTEVSLLGRYTSGAPESRANSRLIPASAGLVAVPGITTSVPEFYDGRGSWTGPDALRFDFQWNLFIPVGKGAEFFTYLSINNLFNSVEPTSFSSTAAGARAANSPDYTYQVGTFTTFGRPSAFGGRRTVNIDLGIRF